jgi:tetratricopeptide (TPR) repeat protein
VLAAAIVLSAPPARAANCAVSAYYPSARVREAALLEAGELASNGRWADARAVYLWVLARHDEDPEALFGLARVDAWGGCWAISEAEYRRVLAAHPGDADVRAGYVDLLVWRGRLAEAERILEEGLGQTSARTAPPLLARAARFAQWRGDATTAVRLADEAEHGAPDDGDVRAMRDRMFLGEARATAHADFYPGGYQNLYSLSTQVLQRAGRFEVYGGAQLLERYGGTTASSANTVLDGRYPFGIAYHPALGATIGAEVAPGAPSNAIPVVALKGWGMAPIVGPFDAFFAYSFWYFAGGEVVHIFNPAFGIALPHDFRLDVRGWISSVILPAMANKEGQSDVVGAGGLALTWSATPRLDAGVTGTYGAEADPGTLYQLLEYRSLLASLFVDALLGRRGGLRPLVGVEYRTPPSGPGLWIASIEMGAYGRW